MSIETQSQISLISKALVLAGEKPCSSLSEDRYGVTVLANLFEIKYESLLQRNRWRFAMKKGSFSRLNVDPLNEWQYAFQIPSDCLLLVGQTYPQPYEVYGNRVYSNSSTFEAEYMFKPAINLLPAYFTLCLAYDLAQDALAPITENDARAAQMRIKATAQYAVAQFADAQARPSRPIIDSPFTAARG